MKNSHKGFVKSNENLLLREFQSIKTYLVLITIPSIQYAKKNKN